jgi:hypothetical protein
MQDNTAQNVVQLDFSKSPSGEFAHVFARLRATPQAPTSPPPVASGESEASGKALVSSGNIPRGEREKLLRKMAGLERLHDCLWRLQTDFERILEDTGVKKSGVYQGSVEFTTACLDIDATIYDVESRIRACKNKLAAAKGKASELVK